MALVSVSERETVKVVGVVTVVVEVGAESWASRLRKR